MRPSCTGSTELANSSRLRGGVGIGERAGLDEFVHAAARQLSENSMISNRARPGRTKPKSSYKTLITHGKRLTNRLLAIIKL
jgi:hypothetical protein